MALRLAVVVGALSILATAAERIGGSWATWVDYFRFSPIAVLHGFVWQVVTYALFEPIGGGFGVFNFLISLYVLYVIGGQIEAAVGPKRFLSFYLLSAVVGAVCTLLVAAALGPQSLLYSYPYNGLWVGIGAMTVYFAYLYGNQPIYLFFVLPVQGRMLVWVSFGILALLALAGGWMSLLPAFFAMLFAVIKGRGLSLPSPRRLWLRMRAFWIERQLKRRSSHLSVIRGGREQRPPPDKPKDGTGPWLH
jgi:membrane associated rhomboid family serine protease